jgi:hypothetical protein
MDGVVGHYSPRITNKKKPPRTTILGIGSGGFNAMRPSSELVACDGPRHWGHAQDMLALCCASLIKLTAFAAAHKRI